MKLLLSLVKETIFQLDRLNYYFDRGVRGKELDKIDREFNKAVYAALSRAKRLISKAERKLLEGNCTRELYYNLLEYCEKHKKNKGAK